MNATLFHDRRKLNLTKITLLPSGLQHKANFASDRVLNHVLFLRLPFKGFNVFHKCIETQYQKR